MFEKEKGNLAPEVGRMLNRLERRVEKGKLNKDQANETISLVNEAILKAKKLLDSSFDFEKATPLELARLTNAWYAWEDNGVFKTAESADLQKKLSGNLTKGGRLNRFGRQVWRTEMTSYLIKKLESSKRTDKAKVVEEIMASQIVGEMEDDPIEALNGAQELDPALYKRSDREALAAKMDASDRATTVKLLEKGYKVSQVRVVTGGDFLTIPNDLAEDFKFKNVIFEDDRVYAQMENGCEGNLVIIDIQKKVERSKEDDEKPKTDEIPKTTEPGKPEDDLELLPDEYSAHPDGVRIFEPGKESEFDKDKTMEIVKSFKLLEPVDPEDVEYFSGITGRPLKNPLFPEKGYSFPYRGGEIIISHDYKRIFFYSSDKGYFLLSEADSIDDYISRLNYLK